MGMPPRVDQVGSDISRLERVSPASRDMLYIDMAWTIQCLIACNRQGYVPEAVALWTNGIHACNWEQTGKILPCEVMTTPQFEN